MAITTTNAALLPNGLGDIAPNLYKSVENVARELVGFPMAVTVNTGEDTAAYGSQINSFRTQAREAFNTNAGHVPSDVDAQNVETPSLKMDNARTVAVKYTQSEMANFAQGDAYGFKTVLSNDIEQAFRTLANEIEADVAEMFTTKRGYDVGTPGTTPFASGSAPTANTAGVRRILNAAGAPKTQRCLVVGHEAAEAILSHPSLARVNESGSSDVLRQGVIGNIGGFDIYESAAVDDIAIPASAVQTGNNNGINKSGGYKKGTKGELTVGGSTGSYSSGGGRVITIGDYNYVTDVAGTNTKINIVAPLIDDVANGATLAAVAAHGVSIALYKGAAELAVRAPARPEKDNASDVMIVRDKTSTLAFEIAQYREHRQVHWEVSVVWGRQVWQPEFVVGLMQ